MSLMNSSRQSQDMNDSFDQNPILIGIEDLYQWIFEDHPLGFYVLDNQQKIVKVNPAFARLLHYDPSELLREPVTKIVSEEDIEAQVQLGADLHAGLINDLDVEGRYVTKYGEAVYCRSLIKAIFTDLRELKYCIVTVLDISKEKQRDQVLQTSKDLWQATYEHAPFGIAILDPATGIFLEVNSALQHALGYSREELIKMHVLDCSPEFQSDGQKSEDLVKIYLERSLTADQELFEWKHLHKDGTERYLEICLNPITQNDRTIVLALAQDRTQEKVRHHHLRASEDRFRNLFENNPLMLFTVDRSGRVMSTNLSAEAQLGYQRNELLGLPVHEVFHPDDQKTVKRNLRAFLAGDQSEASWELRKIKKTGETIWVKEIIKSINWQNGATLIISCENITDRILAEERRKRSEQQYRSIFESNLFGIAIINYEGGFEIVNPAFCEMLGYSKEELYSKNFLDITAYEDLERSRRMSQRMRAEMDMLIIEKKYRRKDGSLLHARTFARMLDPYTNEKAKSLVVIQDISDEQRVKAQERELLQKQDEINYKNRELTSYTLFLTQKSQFLKQISTTLERLKVHAQDQDIRSELSKVIGHINLNLDQEHIWKEFQIRFQAVNPHFLQKLKSQYPELTASELRHCTYVVMHLSNKEAANLLHVTPKAIETARYRIKKKIGLEHRSDKLVDHLIQFL